MSKERDINDLSDGVIKGRLRSLGFLPEDIGKPVIAIANSYNEVAMPHKHLKYLVEHVKQGIAEAGGVGLEFNTIALCDGIAQGLVGAKYVLPSRELIADSVEAMIEAHPIFSGIVCLGGCDKTLPGMMIAAARLNIPTILLGAGPIIPVGLKGALDEQLKRRPLEQICFKDEEFKQRGFFNDEIYDEDFIKQAYLKKLITKEQLIEYYADALSTCGLCTSMATGNSMGILAEGLGMSLPGSFLIPLVANEKYAAAKKVGKAIMRAVELDLTPKKVLTREAFENAIALDMAIGGSMNTFLHLLGIANEAGVPLGFDDFDRISRKVPFIVDVKPNGRYNLIELYRSGGTQAVLHEIQQWLHTDAITINGQTVGENIKEALPLDRKVIYPPDKPLRESGSIVVLRGNIARQGAIAKPVIMSGVEEFVGKAAVFESEIDFCNAAKAGQIEENTVIVIRNEGPKGGPGMSEGHRISEAIRSINIKNIAMVTDGRFSGATIGLVVGYVTPEAADGGEIGIIQTGDTVRISIPEKSLNILVSEEEIARRKALHTPKVKENVRGYLKKYSTVVGSTAKGASTKLWTDK